MKRNKLILASIVITTAFASTSALAVTRGCDGDVAVHVKSVSGQYIGNTSVARSASGTSASANDARNIAKSRLISILSNEFYNNANWRNGSALYVLRNSPRGNYSVEVKAKTYSSNSGGSVCNSYANGSFSIAK